MSDGDEYLEEHGRKVGVTMAGLTVELPHLISLTKGIVYEWSLLRTDANPGFVIGGGTCVKILRPHPHIVDHTP